MKKKNDRYFFGAERFHLGLEQFSWYFAEEYCQHPYWR